MAGSSIGRLFAQIASLQITEVNTSANACMFIVNAA